MAEPFPTLATYGNAPSKEHSALVRDAMQDIIERLNILSGAAISDALASVMVTVFLNQTDPIAAFNLVSAAVAHAIERNLNEQQMGHA